MDARAIILNPTYQLATAAVFLLLLIFWLWRRRTRSRAAAPALITPQEAVVQIAARYPAFGRLMDSFMARNSLATFLEQPEVAKAFGRLQEALQTRAPSSRKKEPALQLQFEHGPALPNEARAALLTVVRCIYFDPNYHKSLDEEARGYLDELLDTLT